MWELDCKDSWEPKNWCLWTVVLEKTLEIPLDCKEIQPVHPKDQSWVFLGRIDFEAETPILWPPDAKSWLIWKDPDAGKDWGQEEKGTTEDEMVGWHHRLNGHGFGWTPGVGDGQGGLACCGSWGHKESDTTEQLNWLTLTLEFIWIPWPKARLGDGRRSGLSELRGGDGGALSATCRPLSGPGLRPPCCHPGCVESGPVTILRERCVDESRARTCQGGSWDRGLYLCFVSRPRWLEVQTPLSPWSESSSFLGVSRFDFTASPKYSGDLVTWKCVHKKTEL